MTPFRSLRRFASLAVAIFGLLTVTTVTAARADQILFQRSGDLYVASMNGSEPRRLFSLTDEGAQWSASPDGRRVAWMTRTALASPDSSATPSPVPAPTPSTPTTDPASAPPATVYLSDMTGIHQKRLFSLDSLRDRRGKRISVVGADLPGDPDDRSSARQLTHWEPLSLAWSADSRTLYISCRLLSPTVPAKATFAVDGATGSALVDGDGRWKSVAPVTDADARGVLLVGSGTAATGAVGPVSAPNSQYYPLILSNLAAGTRTTLFEPKDTATSLPDYAFALDPALSGNDNRYIAFTSANKGLWLLDRAAQIYRQLLDRNVSHPRWSSSATSLFFLEQHSLPDGRVSYDLYGADFAPRTGELATPKVLLQDVAWFDIVPE